MAYIEAQFEHGERPGLLYTDLVATVDPLYIRSCAVCGVAVRSPLSQGVILSLLDITSIIGVFAMVV